MTTVSAAGCLTPITLCIFSLYYHAGEDKVVAFTGGYKDEDIVKFIQGEQLALLTKLSDEVSFNKNSRKKLNRLLKPLLLQ